MTKIRFTHFQTLTISALLAIGLSSCAVSPETQAKMDEFARTIPSCSSDAECSRKWAAARAWVVENSDYAIQGDSDTRISASNPLNTISGIGVIVDRVPSSGGGFQIVADMQCFSAYNCPDLWDRMVDFNRTVNNAR